MKSAIQNPVYVFLNVFFFVFHTGLTLFNLLGWIWKKTRKAHLVTLALTAFSWGVLGIWYGFGYCPSTDWHWQVRRRLGYDDMPRSYVKFLIDALLGLDVNAALVNGGSLALFVLATGAAVYVNVRDWQGGD